MRNTAIPFPTSLTFGTRLAENNTNTTEHDQPDVTLGLDEPQAGSRRPFSGQLLVKCYGRNVHASDELEVSMAGLEPSRRKIADILELTRAGNHGTVYFKFQIDLTPVPSGWYPLTLKLTRGGVEQASVEATLLVDHELGYSSDYERWIEEIERPADEIAVLCPVSLSHVKINVVVIVGEADANGLRNSIESVLSQTWQGWALYLVDTSAGTTSRALVKEYTGESRISVLNLNGSLAGLSASVISSHLPEEGYSCFLKPGDSLAACALAYAASELHDDPDIDLIYADHDFIDECGERCHPVFKPDWSPDLLLSTNYISDILAVRNRFVAELGSLQIGSSPAADYVLTLGLTSRCAKVTHIERVLYHKRTLTEKPLEPESSVSISHAIEEHCAFHGARVKVETGTIENTWRVRYPIPVPVPVSIIIASGGRLDVLEANLASLGATSYLNYEVVVIDNSSDDRVQSFTRSIESGASRLRIRYIDWRRQAFNYSEINNVAARQCSSPLLLFLNDDTSVINPNWLESMVEMAIRPEVGAVGAKLLYPNGRIQHAGIAVGIGGTAAHSFRGMEDNHQQYCNLPDVIRNVSAVTGACLMIRAGVFWEVGGFDADKLPVDFNDLDLCLKVGSRGYRVLYTPHAVLYHHESLTRSGDNLQPDLVYVAEIRSRWATIVARDPFYNSNFTREDIDYSLKSLRLTSPTVQREEIVS